jgi:hypothetical protein
MNDNNLLDMEKLWDRLLSRRAGQVCAAFESLPATQQAAVLAHLRRMASEPGWQAEQRHSARAALKALEELES